MANCGACDLGIPHNCFDQFKSYPCDWGWDSDPVAPEPPALPLHDEGAGL